MSKARHELESLQKFQTHGVPESLKLVLEKGAFRVRALNDAIRAELLDWDRNKINAGYSLSVVCKSQSWSTSEGFKCEGIDWDSTVESAIAHEGASEDLTIRVPGFALRGDRVVPTRTLRPTEYASLWRDWDIDRYLETWSRVRGQRCCFNCFVPIADDAHDRKRFCGEKCRRAAKQRRFRERNPAAIERAQIKYWESLDD